MPNLGKRTKCIKIVLSKASKVMRKPQFPMLFPVLGEHIFDSEIQYIDLNCRIR